MRLRVSAEQSIPAGAQVLLRDVGLSSSLGMSIVNGTYFGGRVFVTVTSKAARDAALPAARSTGFPLGHWDLGFGHCLFTALP